MWNQNRQANNAKDKTVKEIDGGGMLSYDIGGKAMAKEIILAWLDETGGSTLKLLEMATGVPQKLLSPLLAEMIEEKAIKLDGVIFEPAEK